MDVLTLTGNLLAEWTFEIGSMRRGSTHRAESMSFQVGGKGINVTRILGLLGAQSEALAFASGNMARHCEYWLESHGLKHHFFPLGEPVRPGLVIREKEGENLPETTFLGKDTPVPGESWEDACRFAGEVNPTWTAICGSIPGWEASWKDPAEKLMTHGTRLVVDTYGPPLADLAKLPLDLIKINRKELASLLPGETENSFEGTVKRAREVFPVRNWIITDGAREMIAAFEGGSFYSIIPANIREVSAMGSGDTFLAALLSRWKDGMDPLEALRFACGCATGNAASSGIGDFPVPPPDEYFPEISELQ